MFLRKNGGPFVDSRLCREQLICLGLPFASASEKGFLAILISLYFRSALEIFGITSPSKLVYSYSIKGRSDITWTNTLNKGAASSRNSAAKHAPAVLEHSGFFLNQSRGRRRNWLSSARE